MPTVGFYPEPVSSERGTPVGRYAAKARSTQARTLQRLLRLGSRELLSAESPTDYIPRVLHRSLGLQSHRLLRLESHRLLSLESYRSLNLECFTGYRASTQVAEPRVLQMY